MRLALRVWNFVHFAFLLLFLALPALPARANNTRPDVVGVNLGVLDVSAGTTWTSATSSSLRCSKTAASCAAGLVFSEIVVINRHATQTLYVQLKSAASESSVNQITIGPGDSFTLPLYGQSITAVSFLGSGAATTASLVAWLVPN